MHAAQHFAGIFAAAHEHDAFDAGVISDAEDAGGWRRSDADLAQIAHKHGNAFGFGHDDGSNVVGADDQAHAANDHGLLPVVEQRATSILIVGGDGLGDLANRKVVAVE